MNRELSKGMLNNHLTKNNESRKLDLVVDCDYLGYLDVESKYLTHSIIKWLIAEIKLIENEKKLPGCYIEVNVSKNNLCLCKKDEFKRQEMFNHKLSELFKLSYLPNDPVCFGYFYRKNNTSFNYYTLHVFSSSKSNLSQVINDFQQKAIKLHENLIYEKLFDFKLVTKVKFKSNFFSNLIMTHLIINMLTSTLNLKSKKNSKFLILFEFLRNF